MGKLWFVRLRDETGEMQVALDAKRIGEEAVAVRKLLDAPTRSSCSPCGRSTPPGCGPARLTRPPVSYDPGIPAPLTC